MSGNLGTASYPLGVVGSQVVNSVTYAATAWTRTGANSETLTYPVPSGLVALGEEYYK